MFIKAKIRGIPLYTLAQSELFPQIKTLASLWKNLNGDNPIGQAKPMYPTMLLAWLMTTLALLIFFVKPLESTIGAGILILIIGFFFFSLAILAQPWKFVKAVRRLDQCLEQLQDNGIARLPHTGEEIAAFLRERMTGIAYLVLLYEREEGRGSDSAEKWRQCMKNLGYVAVEFGLNFGRHDPYYEEAAARLAREKISAGPVPVSA